MAPMSKRSEMPELPRLQPGWVWLAGAGPGDPGLLTLLAAQALGEADAVVYDALVDERILALARPGAALEFAGKRGGKPSAKQRDISARLIELARAGKRVLRLKGGDPFVFGRGAEEALALVDAGVPFRVVPGITAGVGGLAYAGIPATWRETNSVVSFITGHNSDGVVPDGLDWPAIAGVAPLKGIGFTVAIFMAVLAFDEDVALQEEAKLAILAASLVAAVIGLIALAIRHLLLAPDGRGDPADLAPPE